MNTKETVLGRIAELQAIIQGGNQRDATGEVYVSTVGLVCKIYGVGSPQHEAIKDQWTALQSAKDLGTSSKDSYVLNRCHGILKSLESDIKSGLIGHLRLEHQAEVFADFIVAAKAAVADASKNPDVKNVAAVLACAALEDVLKRFAIASGLDIENEPMGNVIGALRSSDLITAKQATLLEGMTSFRNSAFHAKWDEVDMETTQSVIAFVDQFLFTRYE